MKIFREDALKTQPRIARITRIIFSFLVAPDGGMNVFLEAPSCPENSTTNYTNCTNYFSFLVAPDCDMKIFRVARSFPEG